MNKIAKSLSKAQRKALCELPVMRDFIPAHTGFQWSSLSVLKSKRLINGVKDGVAGLGKDAWHRFTPLGREVRTSIMAKNTPDMDALRDENTRLREALNGYRAAVSFISADAWDGCWDCMDILKAARMADWEHDWAGDSDRIAAELKRIRQHMPNHEH